MKVSKLEIRKFLYFILFGLVTTILVTVCSYSIKEQVEDMQTWQYNATYDFETKIETNKDGEEEFVMYVKTPQQLAGAMNMSSKFYKNIKTNKKSISLFAHMSSLPNSTIKLTSNMNFGGGSWGQYSFYGNLDGQGYVISNLKIKRYNPSGFVTYNYGTIQNLVISNITVQSTYSGSADIKVGGVAGYNSGTIRNVSVVGDSKIIGVKSGKTGGIAGYNSGTIEKCINYAEVTRGEYIGGIAGYSSNSITRCFNYGRVFQGSSMYELSHNIGGIVGCMSSGVLNYCENMAYISGVTLRNGKVCVGGIAGKTYVNITYCGNENRKMVNNSYDYEERGHIRAGDSDAIEAYSGGIVGLVENSADIKYCYNKGKIEATAMKDYYYINNSDAKHYKKSFRELRLYDSTFSKSSSSFLDDKHEYTDRMYANSYNWYVESYQNYNGGIAGWATGNTQFYSCYNTGTVKKFYTPVKNTIDVTSNQSRKDYHTWWVLWNKKSKTTYEYVSVKNRILFDGDYYYSPICPSITSTHENCYTSYSMSESIRRSISMETNLKVSSDNAGTSSPYTWWNTKEWYKGNHWSWSVGKRKIDTTYKMSASNPFIIKLSLKRFWGYYDYCVLYTGIKTSYFSVLNCNGYVAEGGLRYYYYGDPWAVDDNINNGLPYIKDMYWTKIKE